MSKALGFSGDFGFGPLRGPAISTRLTQKEFLMTRTEAWVPYTF